MPHRRRYRGRCVCVRVCEGAQRNSPAICVKKLYDTMMPYIQSVKSLKLRILCVGLVGFESLRIIY